MTSATLYKKSFLNEYSGSIEISSRRFLFVKRNSVTLSPVTEDYLQQNIVHNLDEAKSYLMKMQLSELPELIILDIPLNLKKLTFFKNWLLQNWIPHIHFVYKESFMNTSQNKEIY